MNDLCGDDSGTQTADCAAAEEQLTTEEGLHYVAYADRVSITEYTGEETELVIPAEIAEKPVTKIAGGAFYLPKCSYVVLPDSITEDVSHNGLLDAEDVSYIGKIIIGLLVSCVNISFFEPHGTKRHVACAHHVASRAGACAVPFLAPDTVRVGWMECVIFYGAAVHFRKIFHEKYQILHSYITLWVYENVNDML